jgi:hypothetical protein
VRTNPAVGDVKAALPTVVSGSHAEPVLRGGGGPNSPLQEARTRKFGAARFHGLFGEPGANGFPGSVQLPVALTIDRDGVVDTVFVNHPTGKISI